MRRRQVSAAAEVSLLSARRFWHALGFPNVGDEDTVFTAADLQALRSVVGLVREGVFEETTALSMIRALGRTTDRLAVWQTQLMAEALGDLPEVDARTGLLDADGASSDTSRAVPDPATARAAALQLTEIADRLEPLLVYAWRRHLSAAISRMVADAEPADDHTGIVRSVGFADLVSFTTLVRRMSERQLAQVVQRFEALTSDVVTAHGGRVIKTVGDEVLFVTIGTAPAAAIALDLVQAMGDDDFLPDVRVGMAFGHIVSRLGDVFGTTVNRASRLTGVARPGTVLVDDALAASLSSLSGFEMSPLRRRTLRGIGPVTPWELRRAGQGARRGMVAGTDTPYGDDEPTPDEGDA
jgi:adenylate cyclase